MHLSTEF